MHLSRRGYVDRKPSKVHCRWNAIAEIGVPVGHRTDANVVFDILIADSECIHARKWIATTVADRTSSVP